MGSRISRHAEPAPTRRWASINGTADYLVVTPRTIRRYVAESRLTAYRIGRTVRIDLNEVDAMLERAG